MSAGRYTKVAGKCDRNEAVLGLMVDLPDTSILASAPLVRHPALL